MKRGEGRRRALSLVSAEDADVGRYAEHLPPAPGEVLVLGSADGRVVRALVSRGARVTAVDPSSRMVERAEEARSELGLEAQARWQLTRADLRSLRLPQRFGAVFAPQNAVALMASRMDLEALFATAAAHLDLDAPFVFDAALPPRRFLALEEEESPHDAVASERAVFTPHLRETRRGANAGSGIRRLLLRPFTAWEVDAALTAAGLQAHTRDGGFDDKAWKPGDAVLLVVAHLKR
jgi:SAM-dependent methyltransferase